MFTRGTMCPVPLLLEASTVAAVNRRVRYTYPEPIYNTCVHPACFWFGVLTAQRNAEKHRTRIRKYGEDKAHPKMGKVFNLWHHVASFAAARDVVSLTTMSSKFRGAAAGLWARHSAATAPLKGWSHALEGHRRAVNCLAAVGDTMLASGAADGTIRLWCTGSGAEIGVMEGHDDFVYCLLAVPELDLVASGSKDASVHVWSTVDNGLVFRFKGHAQSVSALARVCDDGLASASHDHDVRIWSLRRSRRMEVERGWGRRGGGL